jgi:hypothetical protein
LVFVLFNGKSIDPMKLAEFSNCFVHFTMVGRWNFSTCRYTGLPSSTTSVKNFGDRLGLAAEEASRCRYNRVGFLIRAPKRSAPALIVIVENILNEELNGVGAHSFGT